MEALAQKAASFSFVEDRFVVRLLIREAAVVQERIVVESAFAFSGFRDAFRFPCHANRRSGRSSSECRRSSRC